MLHPSTPAVSQAMPEVEDAKDPQFAYTLAKGLEVLRAFDAASPSLGNREISQRTGIGRPTVVRLTRTLALLGYLKYHEQTARYRLAAEVLSFGYPLLCQLGVRQLARPHMQELADFARGAVSLAMRGGDHMVLIESCVDKNAPSGRPDVGAIRQFGNTSLGHAYYCATSDKERKEIEDFLKLSDSQTWPALRKQLAASRKTFQANGFCIVPSPGAGMVAISVPLGFMADAELLVMNCAVAQFYLEPDTLEKQVGPRLLNLVRMLQTSLGRR
ncbi:helix-turn-helix domain-containing protein [Limnohabitans sp. Rim8]|jgi:DNA-binding IclR family transcriptional regulator|uniref:IclR family transcriptional regulator n=1 Tax=Limnohabitans sp. Rim8 TaxID=1100718 RepID=UPI003305EB8C